MADLKAAALEAVNQLRTERGMPTLAELPCGHGGDYRACPIANALDAGVCPPTIDFGSSLSDDYEEVRMPEAIEDNDSKDRTFEQIADTIEAAPEGLFV